MSELIFNILERDESYKRGAYQDKFGYWTIGIGRLIDGRKGGGVTYEEALYLLNNDVNRVTRELSLEIPFWSRLNPVRQAVLISMAFQMGVSGLLGFRQTLLAIRESRWDDAKSLMLSSKWATQTPLRASRLAEAMRLGEEGPLRLDEEPPQPH